MRQIYILLSLLICTSIAFAQVSYSGNGNSGFGGAVGLGNLSINDDGTTITCTLTRGSGNFNDNMVMYIANGAPGRIVIDGNVNDGQDENRRAISNVGSGNLTFPDGFEATHAVGLNDTFGGLWSIPATGSFGNNGLDFIDAVGTPTATFTTFSFSFDWTEIGLTSSDNFSFVITYGNPNDNSNATMFSSDEAFGGGVTGGNPGSSSFSYTTYFDYPSGDTGGLATTAQAGDWSLPATWTNGNVPLAGDDVRINNAVTLNQDATVSSLTLNAAFTSESGQSRTLSIEDGGSFSKNGSGSFAANDGSVVFEGSGAITGTIIFNSIEIAGGVAFPSPAYTNDFISNSLTINEGGYLAQTPGGAGITTENDIPGYTNGASLIFTGTFDVNSFASGWGTTVSSTPTNVQVLNGGALTLSLDRNTTNFTVDASSSLTINPARGLTVTGDLTNNGSVTLNSNSQEYSSLIVQGTATGNVTYNRYTAMIAPTGTNDLIASPVSGQQFGAFAMANDGVLSESESGDIRAFAPFNTVTGNYENYDVVTNALTTITPGVGYRAATDSGQTLAFTGTPNNGAVAVSLQDNTSFWNLIGNPYPSYIDIGDFLAENVATTNINTSFYGVYGYDGDVTNGWTVWDLNVNQDLLIAPGQGFFVAAPSGGGSGIDFTTAMRRSGTSDDFIAERNTTSDANFAHAIFNLNTASASYGTNVYFRDINTLGLDPGYDTGAFDQTANGIYSHLVADNTGVALANQSLPFTSLSDQSIPLVVNANAGEQLTFSLNTNSNIPDNINIYLEDQLAGSVTLLNTNSYTLTPASNLSGPGRFYVVFSDNALTTTEQHLDHVRVYTNQSTKTINISGQLDAGTIAMVYDVQGREIITQKLSSESILQHINSDDLSTGVYIVKLYTKTKSKSVKLIIR